VHAVFLVVSPSIPAHLRILAELGFALRNPDLRELLQHRADDQRILYWLRELASHTTGQHRVRPTT
jgi:hypothetical protein